MDKHVANRMVSCHRHCRLLGVCEWQHSETVCHWWRSKIMLRVKWMLYSVNVKCVGMRLVNRKNLMAVVLIDWNRIWWGVRCFGTVYMGCVIKWTVNVWWKRILINQWKSMHPKYETICLKISKHYCSFKLYEKWDAEKYFIIKWVVVKCMYYM